MPAALTAWVLLLVDRVILRRLEDLDAVGQYAIASRLSGVLSLAMIAFVLALGPYLLAVFSESPEQEKARPRPDADLSRVRARLRRGSP